MKTQLQRINEYIDSLEKDTSLAGISDSIVLCGAEGIEPLWASNGECTNNDGSCVKSTNSEICTNGQGLCIDSTNKKKCSTGKPPVIISNSGCQISPVGP